MRLRKEDVTNLGELRACRNVSESGCFFLAVAPVDRLRCFAFLHYSLLCTKLMLWTFIFCPYGFRYTARWATTKQLTIIRLRLDHGKHVLLALFRTLSFVKHQTTPNNHTKTVIRIINSDPYCNCSTFGFRVQYIVFEESCDTLRTKTCCGRLRGPTALSMFTREAVIWEVLSRLAVKESFELVKELRKISASGQSPVSWTERSI